jgi:geranylgeranyl diphosphate synthase type II
MRMTYEAQYEAYLSQAQQALKSACDEVLCPGSRVSEAARYSLLGGGKRVRAVLCIAACDMLGGDTALAARYAAGLEVLHCYSLIHDDLPCMDDDDTRRGRPSCHRAYGEATALLAGDALLTAAFEILACAGQSAQVQNVQAVGVLAAAAGARGMVRGQELDLYYEAVPAGEAQLREVHRNKTGMLMAAAAQLGAIAAGAPQMQQGALRDFAFSVGLVFQMVDDVLDVVSTTQELGKPVGSDAHNGKTTFVTLHGVEGTLALAARTTADACDALAANFGEASAFLCTFAQSLISRTM